MSGKHDKVRRSFRDGDAAQDCCGTERFEPERKALNLPVSYGDELRVVKITNKRREIITGISFYVVKINSLIS